MPIMLTMNAAKKEIQAPTVQPSQLPTDIPMRSMSRFMGGLSELLGAGDDPNAVRSNGPVELGPGEGLRPRAGREEDVHTADGVQPGLARPGLAEPLEVNPGSAERLQIDGDELVHVGERNLSRRVRVGGASWNLRAHEQSYDSLPAHI